MLAAASAALIVVLFLSFRRDGAPSDSAPQDTTTSAPNARRYDQLDSVRAVREMVRQRIEGSDSYLGPDSSANGHSNNGGDNDYR